MSLMKLVSEKMKRVVLQRNCKALHLVDLSGRKLQAQALPKCRFWRLLPNLLNKYLHTETFVYVECLVVTLGNKKHINIKPVIENELRPTDQSESRIPVSRVPPIFPFNDKGFLFLLASLTSTEKKQNDNFSVQI